MVLDGLVSLAAEVAAGLGIMLLFAGGVGLYAGFMRRRRATAVEAASRFEPGEVHEPGVVQVRGTVTPRHEGAAFESPVGGVEDAVLAGWRVDEQVSTTGSSNDGRTLRGVTGVAFHVEGETGQLLVEPGEHVFGDEVGELLSPTALAGADVVTDEVRAEFEPFGIRAGTDHGEAPPERVRRFLERTEGLSVEPMTPAAGDTCAREFREGVVRVGDEVSVVGRAVPRAEGAETVTGAKRLVVRPDGETPLRVSVEPFEERGDGTGALLFGGVALALGLAVLAGGYLLGV